jgi:hypothetical protein
LFQSAIEMRALSRQLRDYADDQADPTGRPDLKMASELMRTSRD